MGIGGLRPLPGSMAGTDTWATTAAASTGCSTSIVEAVIRFVV
jgi:hypothetical protein